MVALKVILSFSSSSNICSKGISVGQSVREIEKKKKRKEKKILSEFFPPFRLPRTLDCCHYTSQLNQNRGIQFCLFSTWPVFHLTSLDAPRWRGHFIRFQTWHFSRWKVGLTPQLIILLLTKLQEFMNETHLFKNIILYHLLWWLNVPNIMALSSLELLSKSVCGLVTDRLSYKYLRWILQSNSVYCCSAHSMWQIKQPS